MVMGFASSFSGISLLKAGMNPSVKVAPISLVFRARSRSINPCANQTRMSLGFWKLGAPVQLHTTRLRAGVSGATSFASDPQQLQQARQDIRELIKTTDCNPILVLGYKGKFWLGIRTFHDIGFKFHRERSITNEEQVDPFALVADELGMLANRLRSMIVTEIPKLATAAEYFFKMGVEGKRFRPMVLLLMASSLTMAMPEMAIDSVREGLAKERRLRQQRIAEITEMIHVASLLHDDVLDDADTRRGIGSLNFVMGNKLAVLAGDFLLSRASVALASLKNTEVVELLSKVLEDLVTGEIMQITSSSEQCCSMEYYMRKTFYKTASLMANSCKAIALLGGQPTEVCMLAYDYGRHLGLAFQLVDDVLDFTGMTASLGKGSLSDIRQGIITAPLLFALEEFPQLKGVIDRKFKDPRDIDLALEFLGKSEGIRKTKQLAVEHAHHAASAIDSLPPSESENVRICRKALVDLTEKVITRTK